jgi:hypothetical protein
MSPLAVSTSRRRLCGIEIGIETFRSHLASLVVSVEDIFFDILLISIFIKSDMETIILN